MNASVKRLEETGSALRDALTQQDWVAISMLDRECRNAVDEAMQAHGRDNGVVRQRLQELLDLYGELVMTCQIEQARVASELRQLNQSQQGTKVYQLFV
ncbi:flagellar protein FliT [Stutzerimonas chloritidismutans]|uniref:flagellar protein FliT n=1 Tax=Stutzerimonas chloritidismutans TaxID=203192 RepID=UPI003F15820A